MEQFCCFVIVTNTREVPRLRWTQRNSEERRDERKITREEALRPGADEIPKTHAMGGGGLGDEAPVGRNEFPFPPVGLEANVEGPSRQAARQSGSWEWGLGWRRRFRRPQGRAVKPRAGRRRCTRGEETMTEVGTVAILRTKRRERRGCSPGKAGV